MVDPASQPPRKFPTREWFVDFLKIFTVGKALAFIMEKHGLAALVFFLLGIVVMGGIVWLGWAPNILVSTYKTESAEVKYAAKPTHLDLIALDPIPEWIQPYLSWLEQEGEAQLKEHAIAGHKECAFRGNVSTESGNVPDFNWELRTERDTEINGFGFKEADGMFQPLVLSKSGQSTTPSVIRFSVAGARGGNKVISVLRLTWKQGDRSESCEEMLRSSVH